MKYRQHHRCSTNRLLCNMLLLLLLCSQPCEQVAIPYVPTKHTLPLLDETRPPPRRKPTESAESILAEIKELKQENLELRRRVRQKQRLVEQEDNLGFYSLRGFSFGNVSSHHVKRKWLKTFGECKSLCLKLSHTCVAGVWLPSIHANHPGGICRLTNSRGKYEACQNPKCIGFRKEHKLMAGVRSPFAPTLTPTAFSCPRVCKPW